MSMFYEKIILGGRRRPVSFFVNSYGNDQTRGVYTFQIDIKTGELIFKKHFKTPSDPIYSFNYGRFVCSTYKNRSGAASEGGISSYTSTADTLSLVSKVSNDGKTYLWACTNGDDVVADKVFGVDYYNGEIMVAKIVKKKLVKTINTVKLEGKGTDEIRQTQPHPHWVGVLPDNLNKLCVVDLGLDKILIYDIEPDGQLILDEKHSFDVKPGSGPRQMYFSNGYAYVVNELISTIDVYKYNDCEFELIQTVDTYNKTEFPDEVNLPGNFTMDKEGDFAFVTNRGHDSLSSFTVDKETGKLTYRDFVDTSPGPRDVKVFGNYLVVACQKGASVESYEYVKEKKGALFDTNSSYMITEPVLINEFFDITNPNK